MATPDSSALAALSRSEVAGLAALWPRTSLDMAVTLVEPMHVLSLRHLPAGGSTVLAATLVAQGLPGLPEPGQYVGLTEPRMIWRSPSETLLLTPDAVRAAALLAALQPALGAMACAVDVSHGSLVARLQGADVDGVLSRMVDAQSAPRKTGKASRMRLADIAAVVWRESPDRVGLLVDRADDHYLAQWLAYAADAL